MATVTEIEVLADACSNALAAGDFDAARLKWAQLTVLVGAKPDVTGPEISTRWDRAALAHLREAIEGLAQRQTRPRRRVLAGFRNRGT